MKLSRTIYLDSSAFFRRNIGFPYSFHTAGAGWKGGEGTNINIIFEFTERFLIITNFVLDFKRFQKTLKLKGKLRKQYIPRN